MTDENNKEAPKKTKLDRLHKLVYQFNVKLMRRRPDVTLTFTKYSESIYIISARFNMMEYLQYCIGYDENIDEYFWSSRADFNVRTKDMGDLPS